MQVRSIRLRPRWAFTVRVCPVYGAELGLVKVSKDSCRGFGSFHRPPSAEDLHSLSLTTKLVTDLRDF